MRRVLLGMALLSLASLPALADEPESAPPAVQEHYAVAPMGALLRAMPFRPVQTFALRAAWEHACVLEVEQLAASLEALKTRAAAGEVLAEADAAQAGRCKEALCAAVAKVQRQEDSLMAESARRVNEARCRAGVCATGGTAFAIEREAITEIRDLLQRHEETLAWADARRVVREWRMLAAVAPIRAEAREAAEQLEQCVRNVEARADLAELGLRITGVIVHTERPTESVALVNGYILRSGDSVRPENGVELDRIENDRVWVRFRGLVLPLSAGPGA